MKIILIGAPGSGKGTQAAQIEKKYNLPHISTGDIFRYNIRNKTEIGLEAKKYMDEGQLVPDEVTLRIVDSRLIQDDCKPGFLLDGFPRTINQADALEQNLKKHGSGIDIVVNLDVRDETILERVTGRRICSKCGATYNIYSNKPKVENICDNDGGELYIRDDDKKETVIKRLDVYRTQTQPLIKYYSDKGLLVTVDGEQDLGVVMAEIVKAMEQKR